MDAASNFARGEKARDGLAITIKNTGLVINLEAAHGIMKNWLHDGDMEEVVHSELPTRIILNDRRILGLEWMISSKPGHQIPSCQKDPWLCQRR
jgi:hypothetical protein